MKLMINSKFRYSYLFLDWIGFLPTFCMACSTSQQLLWKWAEHEQVSCDNVVESRWCVVYLSLSEHAISLTTTVNTVATPGGELPLSTAHSSSQQYRHGVWETAHLPKKTLHTLSRQWCFSQNKQSLGKRFYCLIWAHLSWIKEAKSEHITGKPLNTVPSSDCFV